MKTALIAATLLLGFAATSAPQSAQAAPLSIASFAASVPAVAEAGSNDLLHTVRDRGRNNRASDGFRRSDFGNRNFGQRRFFNQRRSTFNRGFRGSRFGNRRFFNRGFVNRGFFGRGFGRGFGHGKFGKFGGHGRFGFSSGFFFRH